MEGFMTRDEVLEQAIEYFNGDELAAQVFLKYALQDSETYYEGSPSEALDRYAREIHRIESRYPNPLSYDRIRHMLDRYERYILGGSPMAGVGNNYLGMSLSNCVVSPSPKDSISGIFDVGKKLAIWFSRRCGVGSNISTLRPDGFPVSNAAKTSTGAWSFVELLSNICGKIGQNNRRGALLVGMEDWHPDILKFITCKIDVTKITNANISVMLSDAFMKAVEMDGTWDLVWDGKVVETIKARDMWNLIVTTATKTAEPGILFWDTYKRRNPLNEYPGFEMICTNPCSELGLGSGGACMLSSLNLKGFVRDPYTEGATFNYSMYESYVMDAVRIMDDLIDLELEALDRIIKSTSEDSRDIFELMADVFRKGRRIGLGITGLADALVGIGVKYGSVESLDVVENIIRTHRDAAYRSSIQLGRERGVFPAFDWDIEKDNEFLKSLSPDLYNDISSCGRRHGALLTIPPVGSGSQLGRCSTGIEPIYRRSYIRRKKSTPGERIDSVDSQGIKWTNYMVIHPSLLECALKHGYSREDVEVYLSGKGSNPELEKLLSAFVSSDEIDWMDRVKVQSVLTQYLDHGCSSTINLPAGTSSEVVGNIYMESYKQGLKGVTVYVDGSRDGVLLSKEPDKDWFHRPKELFCDIHCVEAVVDKVKKRFVVIVSFKSGIPFEVFGGAYDDSEISEEFPPFVKGKIIPGKVVKHKRESGSRYELQIEGDGVVHSLGKEFHRGTTAGWNKLISLSLRSQPDNLPHVVDQLSSDSDVAGYSKAVSRVLKKYVEDGAISGGRCENCGQKTLVYEAGCCICTSCSYSGCS